MFADILELMGGGGEYKIVWIGAVACDSDILNLTTPDLILLLVL